MPLRSRPSIALLIETSNVYGRGMIEGVRNYERVHHPWSISLPEMQRGGDPPPWLEDWSGSGIIARIENQAMATAIRKTGLPVVDVSAARLLPDAPCVETDDRAIAKAASSHLIERGFRDLAYSGEQRYNWSSQRGEYFRQYAEAANCRFHEYSSPATIRQPRSTKEIQRLSEWLESLPRPVGIMTNYDLRAQLILDLCRDLNIAVPEEIAVVSVDNDTLLCDLCDPPLSSVILDAHRTGYLAASLLDQLMAGEELPGEIHLVLPLGLQTRQSTDVTAVDDSDVAAALRYIREYACEGIQVNDVIKQVPVSRRVLESRFKDYIGRSPHEEINRIRMQRVKTLLVETNLTLATIAKRSGFNYVEYMNEAFKKQVGTTPGKYRKEAFLAKGAKPRDFEERGA